jgi:Asp/Glu/hydantoin racemase
MDFSTIADFRPVAGYKDDALAETGPVFKVRKTHFYGAPVGVLMLDASEPYLPGDMGNASTFRFPVRFRRVVGATIDRLVHKFDPSITAAAVSAAKELVSEGAQAIAGNCGFMIRLQRDVADALDVPVLLSSLVQLPLVERCISAARRIGIVTASAAALDVETVALTGVDVRRVAVIGMDGCPEFQTAFMREEGAIRPQLIEQEVAQVTAELIRNNDIGAIVVECAALPPYSHVMRRVAGSIPVFDATTLVDLWYEGMFRKAFTGHY